MWFCKGLYYNAIPQMSCHLLPAESTDDEICVDPAEDVRDNKAKFPEPPGSNSVFQVGSIKPIIPREWGVIT